MKPGFRYLVTKASENGTFVVGDHTSMNTDGSINCYEAEGWVEACDVPEAIKGMEVEVDQEWLEKRRQRILADLSEINAIDAQGETSA